jgi:exopolyphosphatase/guanosine-5'-triphosphate,3'-diphosphate pyrophosphatase
MTEPGRDGIHGHLDAAYRPDRAVVDIGSNTVRLVIYSGSRRAPRTWLNEKVSARLGRDLSATGRMPEKAMAQALRALARYALLLTDLRIGDVQTVATAAVREASNGGAFLDRVRELGLAPRLLSGEEEAFGAAFGVIGAFPGARGTVADLGGGSLELVMIEQDDCHDGVSLPLGTLRLPALRKRGPAAFRTAIERELARAGWASAHSGALYMVGGTWRALAAFAINRGNFPLNQPHGFTLDRSSADGFAQEVMRLSPETLTAVPGISASRAAGLPDAAAMLRVMLTELQPDGLVFSGWGLREGLLFEPLSPQERSLDPLVSAVAEFAAARGGSLDEAAAMAEWIGRALPAERQDDNRLRLATTTLALAGRHIEPAQRARHVYEWAIEKGWIGLDASGRARMAAALLAACGKVAPPAALERLADWSELSSSIGWGLAIRLCRRLSAGSSKTLASTTLRREGGKLVLEVAANRRSLASDKVIGDLKTLAQWVALEPELRVS